MVANVVRELAAGKGSCSATVESRPLRGIEDPVRSGSSDGWMSGLTAPYENLDTFISR